MKIGQVVGELTQQQLKSVLSYDQETGWFIWTKNAANPGIVGTIAGTVGNGYRHIIIHGRSYTAHRLAWLYVHGVMPEMIDHADGDRDNNRIGNLRIATASQNAANSIKPSSNTSGAKGVFLNASGKFEAVIRKDGKQHRLGSYDNFEDAREAYRVGAERLFGEFSQDGEREQHTPRKRKVGPYHPLRVKLGHDHKSLTPARPDQPKWSTQGISRKMAKRVARVLNEKENNAKFLERVMKRAEKQQKRKNVTELFDKK